MMNAKHARKEDVLEKLDSSIRYCNSHRDNVQDLYDSIVEQVINQFSGLNNPKLREHEMKSLFPVITDPTTRGFIPTIKMKQDELDLNAHTFLERWLTRWVNKFTSAWKNLPSQRLAEPKKAVTDYALINMVAPHAGSEEAATEWVRYHNLYMSAENIGGNLLEEYIASKVADFGWIWCRGEILTAVDFCNDDCTKFVQVKNKSNTENSSGKGFREDHKAPVWFRMYAEKKRGAIVTRWPDLVEIIKRGATKHANSVPDDLLSENEYLTFIRKASEANPRLITDKEK